MSRAKLGPVQIRLTLLDAVVLSSRVKTESIQYEIMIVIIFAQKQHFSAQVQSEIPRLLP